MVQIKLGLRKKITFLCIVIAVVLCLGSCLGGYFMFRQSTYQTYNTFAYGVAYHALDYIDGDHIIDYLNGRPIDEDYETMQKELCRLVKHHSLGSIYIAKIAPAEKTITNIFDTRITQAENPEIFAIGVVDPLAVNVDDLCRILETKKPVDNYFIHSSSFGYVTSAILPILNNKDEVVALLTVDMPMPTIIARLQNYLKMIIAITAISVSIMMALYLIYLQHYLIEPIQKLTLNAASFAANHNSFSNSIEEFKTGDEIETLARSFVKMGEDIQQYISNLASVTAERERIATELNIAEQIQSDMLPRIFPPYPDCDSFNIYATMDPAKEVGGDFYDFFLIDPDHVGLVMADVSGKGVPAALFMVISKTLIKNSALAGGTPKEIMEHVNQQLCENNDASMFVTVWFGILELSTGIITAVNAGHEKPVVKPKDGDFEYLRDKHGLIMAAMDIARYKEYTIQLQPGDRLFLYTDGLLEATNSSDELYGEERALTSLNQHKDETLQDLLKSVRKDVDEFVSDAPQFDDLTMMVLEYYGSEK